MKEETAHNKKVIHDLTKKQKYVSPAMAQAIKATGDEATPA